MLFLNVCVTEFPADWKGRPLTPGENARGNTSKGDPEDDKLKGNKEGDG